MTKHPKSSALQQSQNPLLFACSFVAKQSIAQQYINPYLPQNPYYAVNPIRLPNAGVPLQAHMPGTGGAFISQNPLLCNNPKMLLCLPKVCRQGPVSSSSAHRRSKQVILCHV